MTEAQADDPPRPHRRGGRQGYPRDRVLSRQEQHLHRGGPRGPRPRHRSSPSTSAARARRDPTIHDMLRPVRPRPPGAAAHRVPLLHLGAAEADRRGAAAALRPLLLRRRPYLGRHRLRGPARRHAAAAGRAPSARRHELAGEVLARLQKRPEAPSQVLRGRGGDAHGASRPGISSCLISATPTCAKSPR